MYSLFAAETAVVEHPTSGDYWNPANWVALIHELGFSGLMALVMFAACAWLVWRSLRDPVRDHKRLTGAIELLWSVSETRHKRIEKAVKRLAFLVVAPTCSPTADLKSKYDELVEELNEPVERPVTIDLDERSPAESTR
jgi:hypothetical protein